MLILNADRYINEKLNIKPVTKTRLAALSPYKYKPKTKGELIVCIENHIEEYGFFCNLNDIDVSCITNFSYLFSISTLKDFDGNISEWNVRNAKNMTGMFQSSKFNGDISNWNVGNVTNMSYMFYNSYFDGDISKWNVGKVLNMENMFQNSDFNGDISNWNVSCVTKMSHMFCDSRFKGDLSRWSVGNVWHRHDIFKNCPMQYEEELQPDFRH